jgi:hypothetical protein
MSYQNGYQSNGYQSNGYQSNGYQPTGYQYIQPQTQYGVGMTPQQPQINTSPYSYNSGNSLNQNNMNQFGLRDKTDSQSGLVQKNPLETQFTTLENTIYIDTRDCIGTQSLTDARAYFVSSGGRASANGTISSTTGIGTNPIVVTFNSVSELKDGDTIIINGVRGNTNVNGVHVLSSINPGLNTAVITSGPNGNYAGGGTWNRPADNGYPELKDTDSTIVGNVMTVALNKELKNLRDITLFHVVVPRDIIPLYYWLSDFIIASVDSVNHTYTLYTGGTVTTDYTTRIPQEAWFMAERMIGFYSTPLDLWRTYEYGAFSMQNAITPPPLQLWNPPGPGVWPNFQPVPYPFQTVPTYRSNGFSVIGQAGIFYLVLSGYGIYDLVDWTIISSPPTPATDAINTSIIRKLLLLLLCPIQSYGGVDYIDMILNCSTTSNTNAIQAYGFGDFQRYVPGPGQGLTYQPDTNAIYDAANASGPPNVAWPDSPIPFPNFRGNVWGPYSSPGDRFQKLGLRDIVQDLYMNGDLNNLLGSPIIVTNVPAQAIPQDPSFGLNFSSLIPVTLGNVTQATNPNIVNAMRIVANGFGAAVIRAEGANNPGPVGPYYTSQYQNAGGIGPSTLGTPSAWVNIGVYGGAGSFTDPIAQGPAGPGLTPASADASSVGTGAAPSHLASFFDLGPNNGAFQTNIQNYIGYSVNDIPDNDLIIRIEEALRDERAQSTRSFNGDALLDCPIRLNLGSSAGTIQYVEALQALLAQGTGYWEKRYLNPKTSLFKLHLNFFTYDGKPIPLERMLQPRAVSAFLQIFVRINNFLDINFSVNPFSFNFLFDPSNPQLLGRMKRYLSIIFKIHTYEGTPPGNEPTAYTQIPASNQVLRGDLRNFA